MGILAPVSRAHGGQRAPNPPELAQPRLGRSNGRRPQWEGTSLGVFVPVWQVLPWREATNFGAFDLCHFDLFKWCCASSGGFGARWGGSGSLMCWGGGGTSCCDGLMLLAFCGESHCTVMHMLRRFGPPWTRQRCRISLTVWCLGPRLRRQTYRDGPRFLRFSATFLLLSANFLWFSV